MASQGMFLGNFVLKQGIDFIIFSLNQGIDLKEGIFSCTINSLRVCSTN